MTTDEPLVVTVPNPRYRPDAAMAHIFTDIVRRMAPGPGAAPAGPEPVRRGGLTMMQLLAAPRPIALPPGPFTVDPISCTVED